VHKRERDPNIILASRVGADGLDGKPIPVRHGIGDEKQLLAVESDVVRLGEADFSQSFADQVLHLGYVFHGLSDFVLLSLIQQKKGLRGKIDCGPWLPTPHSVRCSHFGFLAVFVEFVPEFRIG
jgi:hypothetical protein